MKIQWKPLAACLGIPLAAGSLSAFLTSGSMEQFQRLNQPPLSPPGWLFPVVWTVLFLLMGAASYLVYTSGRSRQARRAALDRYGAQLIVNFFWPVLFFNLNLYLPALLWLIFLWFLILLTIRAFLPISRLAGYLLIPYLLWVTFAGYLNLGVYLLN